VETLVGLGGEVWTKETIRNLEWMIMERFGRRREVYQLWLRLLFLGRPEGSRSARLWRDRHWTKSLEMRVPKETGVLQQSRGLGVARLDTFDERGMIHMWISPLQQNAILLAIHAIFPSIPIILRIFGEFCALNNLDPSERPRIHTRQGSAHD
jgi:hypothetical protein